MPDKSGTSLITRLDPPRLASAVGYCQVTVAAGTRTVYVSGQVGIGPDGDLAGPDHHSQTAQAMRNLVIALETAGASMEDVAKATFYVVDYAPEVMGSIFEASAAVFGLDAPPMAVTLVGVAALADPAYLIEIEVTAVLA